MIETKVRCDECLQEMAEEDIYHSIRIDEAEMGTYDSEYLLDIELCLSCYQKMSGETIGYLVKKLGEKRNV